MATVMKDDTFGSFREFMGNDLLPFQSMFRCDLTLLVSYFEHTLTQVLKQPEGDMFEIVCVTLNNLFLFVLSFCHSCVNCFRDIADSSYSAPLVNRTSCTC